MFNADVWNEKKQNSSELCKDIVHYAEKEIMKWVNPQTVLTDREKRMIKKSNKILVENGIISGSVTYQDLVMLVKEA